MRVGVFAAVAPKTALKPMCETSANVTAAINRAHPDLHRIALPTRLQICRLVRRLPRSRHPYGVPEKGIEHGEGSCAVSLLANVNVFYRGLLLVLLRSASVTGDRPKIDRALGLRRTCPPGPTCSHTPEVTGSIRGIGSWSVPCAGPCPSFRSVCSYRTTRP